MCYEPSGYIEEEIDGICSFCGSPTVDGDAFEKCEYSHIECEICGYAPCDGSCC